MAAFRRHPLLTLGALCALLLFAVPASGSPSGSAMSDAEQIQNNAFGDPSKIVEAPANSDAAAQVQAKLGMEAPGSHGGAHGGAAGAAAQQALQPAARISTMSTSAAEAAYDLDFTLPTAGKSGCLVCHADPNLIRLRSNEVVSYYVDPDVIGASVHAGIQCTGCHLDFAYKAPHDSEGDWRRIAKLACKNCHKDQFEQFGIGVHTMADSPGKKDRKADKKPLCGDCHGAHEIRRLNARPDATADVKAEAAAGKAALHAKGYEVCGRCHPDWWQGYADYYHGRAYKTGAGDAPACWQCHGWHGILPSKDKRSAVHANNLVNTCGQCHKNNIGSGAEQYASYSGLIHRHPQTLQANPVVIFLKDTTGTLGGVMRTVRSWF